MPEFSTMLSLQAQMMLLLAIGIFLTKKHIITEQGRACLTDLLLFLILPANIIQSFRIEFNVEIFRSTRDILILSILLQMLYGVICAVCYNCYPFARKAVMQYGTVCSNVVQDEETKKKNRDALFADLEGNLDIGGEAAKEQKK